MVCTCADVVVAACLLDVDKYKWVSFSYGILHFVRPPHCINVRRISRCLALCSVLYEGTVSVRCFICFIFFSGWLFGVYFSRVLLLCVTVQIHNEVGTNGTNAHTLIFLASNVLLLFSSLFFYSKVLNMKFVFIRSVDTERSWQQSNCVSRSWFYALLQFKSKQTLKTTFVELARLLI